MIAISVNITGQFEIEDKRAAKFACSKAGIALPLGTQAELRAAYESLLASLVKLHIHNANVVNSMEESESVLNIKDLKSALIDAPVNKRNAAIAAALAALA